MDTRRHRCHHPIRADGDDAIGVPERDGLLTQRVRGIGVHRLDDVADEGLVLRAVRSESRFLVAAPDNHVSGSLDLRDLVAVDHVFIAGKIKHSAARFAHCLADREEHRIAEAAARQYHGFVRRDFRGRAGRSHQNHRVARFEEQAQIA